MGFGCVKGYCQSCLGSCVLVCRAEVKMFERARRCVSHMLFVLLYISIFGLFLGWL